MARALNWYAVVGGVSRLLALLCAVRNGWIMSSRIYLFFAASLLLSSCTTTVQAPGAPLGQVTIQGGNGVPSAGTAELQSEGASEAEMEMEGVVSRGCLDAWRKALKGDEKGSMSVLDDLSRKYPSVTTVTFMKGECLDRLGKKKEAIQFYKQAVSPKEFSTLHIFKLAEALRTTGQNKDAIPQYRRLIEIAPGFAPGHIGLATSLLALDKHSPEATKELDLVLSSCKSGLASDPYSAEAREYLQDILTVRPNDAEAAALLKKMGPPPESNKTADSSKVQ
jgi:tetratricopeptide (TPR) repeat protein